MYLGVWVREYDGRVEYTGQENKLSLIDLYNHNYTISLYIPVYIPTIIMVKVRQSCIMTIFDRV